MQLQTAYGLADYFPVLFILYVIQILLQEIVKFPVIELCWTDLVLCWITMM